MVLMCPHCKNRDQHLIIVDPVHHTTATGTYLTWDKETWRCIICNKVFKVPLPRTESV